MRMCPVPTPSPPLPVPVTPNLQSGGWKPDSLMIRTRIVSMPDEPKPSKAQPKSKKTLAKAARRAAATPSGDTTPGRMTGVT